MMNPFNQSLLFHHHLVDFNSKSNFFFPFHFFIPFSKFPLCAPGFFFFQFHCVEMEDEGVGEALPSVAKRGEAWRSINPPTQKKKPKNKRKKGKKGKKGN